MFAFAPPATPVHVESPCPNCGERLAVPFYATSMRAYFKCRQCGFVFLGRNDDQDSTDAS